MNDEDTDIMIVTELLEFCDDLIIARIAEPVTSDFADFLQRVNDNEPHIVMLFYEVFQLTVKPVAEHFCLGSKMQFVIFLHIEHI